jgi:PAS domain S-box-containing protein
VRGMEEQSQEQWRIYDALKRSEARFSAIIEAMNDAVFVVHVQTGNVEDVNQRAVEMFGYERATFQHLNLEMISEGVPPYTLRELLRRIRRSSDKSMQLIEWRARRRDDSLFWAELNMRRLDLDNAALAVIVARDVTERKESEQLRSAMYRIAFAAQATDSLQALFEFVHGIVADLMPADNFYIAIYDKENDMISYPYFVDAFEDSPEPHSLNRGLTAHVLRTGSVILNTPDKSLELLKQGTEMVGPSSVDWLGAPLRTARGTLGVIAVQTYDTDRRLREQDREILAFIASQVATAIERKWADEEIQQSKEELEQRVEERTAELTSANRELESFSYSVSHDLRAPLRAIDGYSRMLQDAALPVLDAESQRLLKVIRENARQMGRLIDDLLAFSRLSRHPLNLQLVNQADVIQDALSVLALDVLPELQISPMPPVQADPALLKQVWVNLLSNAIKFTRTTPNARIEIGSFEQSGETVYFIRDNGVGFDMAYATNCLAFFNGCTVPKILKARGLVWQLFSALSVATGANLGRILS